MSLSARVEPYDAADALMRSDLRHYSRKLVKISDKRGELRPFEWNEAQVILHKKLERQLEWRH